MAVNMLGANLRSDTRRMRVACAPRPLQSAILNQNEATTDLKWAEEDVRD
jgi:hypothetical protein